MPVIFSKELDESTNHVIMWLHFYEQYFIRINDDVDEDISHIYININNGEFMLDNGHNIIITNESASSVWFRRGSLNLIRKSIVFPNLKLSNELNIFLNNECNALRTYLNRTIPSNANVNINRESDFYVNKLIALNAALKSGIDIPETIITTEKKSLIQFKKKHERIITKPITEVLTTQIDMTLYEMYTNEVADDMINSLPDTFAPSLFQNRIEKLFEIRAFFYRQKFYSMAIFSQESTQTQTDSRRPNSQNPSRTIPYKLPMTIESRLSDLMGKLNINCGSIDIIFNTKQEYIFLEVNPVGQFSMVSIPCNYYLEKIIAQDLIKYK